MAEGTGKALRSQIIYSVFVRQYSAEGTFEALRKDLPRIRALGADILWLLPIHPIGAVRRKGTLGSPYAIRDYRAVDPEYGTREELARLVGEIHECGMKCILDVVYHHTSPDSVLAQTHPEWFFRKADGSFGNRIGDWSDVIDLDYRLQPLWDYQIETLVQWAELVDGFRCDVAPLVPLAFWKQARAAVEAVRPGSIWLAESVEPEFIRDCRARGIGCLSDGELYEAFDLCYDYDVYGALAGVLDGRVPLASYLRGLMRQESAYPENYVKLHFLENHDRARACALIPEACRLRNWTAFLYFQKGTTLLYNGQECGARRCPGLFDRDPIDWQAGVPLTPLLTRLGELRHKGYFSGNDYTLEDAGNGFVLGQYRSGAARVLGLFSTEGRTGAIPVPLADGSYTELISGGQAGIRDGKLLCSGEPLILAAGETK
jgi:glycosidase